MENVQLCIQIGVSTIAGLVGSHEKRHGKLTRDRAREERDKGRTFSSLIDELYWAQTEVKRFLKSRSRSISLHETDDPILEQVAYQVIYEA